VVECQQAWYFCTSTSYCAVLSPSAYFTSYLPFVLDEDVAGVCYFPWDVSTTVKQLFRCTATAYLSCLLSSSQNVSNGSHTSMYTAFHYKRGIICTWSLRHVHFSFSNERIAIMKQGMCRDTPNMSETLYYMYL